MEQLKKAAKAATVLKLSHPLSQQALFLFRRLIPNNNNNSTNYGEPYIPIQMISSLTDETI